jgi:hypothetical protein
VVLGLAVGVVVGELEGLADVGLELGAAEGDAVGADVGVSVGAAVDTVGANVGADVGGAVGEGDGAVDGAMVGATDGTVVGVTDGERVGSRVDVTVLVPVEEWVVTAHPVNEPSANASKASFSAVETKVHSASVFTFSTLSWRKLKHEIVGSTACVLPGPVHSRTMYSSAFAVLPQLLEPPTSTKI